MMLGGGFGRRGLMQDFVRQAVLIAKEFDQPVKLITHPSRAGKLTERDVRAIYLKQRLFWDDGSPIIPIAIWGTEAGLKGALLRKPIHVQIGQPYYVHVTDSKIPFDRMNELTDEMMLAIARLLPEQYWGFYQEKMLTQREIGG